MEQLPFDLPSNLVDNEGIANGLKVCKEFAETSMICCTTIQKCLFMSCVEHAQERGQVVPANCSARNSLLSPPPVLERQLVHILFEEEMPSDELKRHVAFLLMMISFQGRNLFFELHVLESCIFSILARTSKFQMFFVEDMQNSKF